MKRGGPVRALFELLILTLPRRERQAVGRRVLDDVERGWRTRREREGLFTAVRFAAREALDVVWNAALLRLAPAGSGARTTRSEGRMGMEGIGFDVRVAVRGLLKTPALVVGSVVTLAIGIGVNLALVSVLHGVLLRPLPFGEPDRLVTVYSEWDGGQELGLTWHDIRTLHDDAETLEAVAGVLLPGMDTRFMLSTPDGPEPLQAVRVSPNFFTVLDVQPVLGSGVAADHPTEETAPAVMISDAAWSRRWGRDPDLVDRTLRINDDTYTVAGVLPPDFSFQLGARPPEFFVVRTPAGVELEDRSNIIIQPVARLRTGASLADATREIDRLEPRLDEERATDVNELPLGVRSLHEHLVGDLTAPLLALGAAALLVLVVACANLAALFLARHTEREADQALRAALGAGRARLARLPLLEALILGLAGGLLGLALATLATDVVLGRVPDPLFRYSGFGVGPLVGAAAVALAVGAGFLFGGVPAWRAGRTRPASVLRRSGSRGAAGGTRATRWLAGAEAAALLVLLVATGLSLRSLSAMLEVDLGFESRNRAAATVPVPQGRYDRQAFATFINELEGRLEAHPRVRAAGTVTHLPLDPNSWGGSLAVEGEPADDASRATEWELASPGYFEAAGIELLRGRSFTPEDGPSTPPVVVVSRELARTMRPSGDPGDVLGLRISGTGPDGPWMEVVGVVEDVRQRGVARPPRPHMYMSHAQAWPFPERELVVAAASPTDDPLAVLREIVPIVQDLEPDAVLDRPRTLESMVDRALGTPRVVTSLLGLFGAASLLLALTGIYGVTAFAVARRRREIGIRACLGAERSELFGRALGEALLPVGVGAAVGLAVVAVAAPRVERLLYGVEPLDPVTLVVVPLLLLGAAAGTACWPAMRAARTDPVEVLGEG